MAIKSKLITGPAVEPVTLAEMEMHLRIESNDIASDLTSTQSIAPAAHVVAPAYSNVGTGVDVLNTQAVVYFNAGTNGVGGTVDIKIQESDDDVIYTDVSGGAFTQVTEANDNATYEKAYTGIKQYIRVVATVAVATCSFGVNVVTSSPLSIEDDYISSLIKTSRKTIELLTGRRFINQTWELALDSFPNDKRIRLPYAPLSSVTSVKYYSSDDTEYTFAASSYYVDTYKEPGQIALNSSASWPSGSVRPTNGVIIQYVVGYGATAASVDDNFKQAIKILGAELYEGREASAIKRFEELPYSVQTLMGFERLIPV